MSRQKIIAAVDLGASSGRVMVGRVGADRLELSEAHRFANEPVRVGDTLHWDVLGLYRGVLAGLRAAGPVDSIGIDSWAVDHGLIDDSGALVGNPVHYRDARTATVLPELTQRLGAERLFRTTGLQQQPFNTLYQLVAASRTPSFAVARTMLLMPDLFAYWLTGETGAEYTNATTTQLFDCGYQDWAWDLIADAGLPASLFPPIRKPGDVIGPARDLPGRPNVVAVGSHDTASAVVGVPARGGDFAYISCGTWSLVGLELDGPVLTAEARRANFTNEGGVDGTIRFLRNVMGLWPLQECMRAWATDDIVGLLRAAAQEPALRSVVDLDDPVFLPPGDMPARIAEACRRAGEPVPDSHAAFTRCVLDSLALAHHRAIDRARHLTGAPVEVVHIVGGGARNELLCQLTADACGLPVLAGPVEATALGNVLVQARAAGVIQGDLSHLRSLLRQTQAVTTYRPAGDGKAWRNAEERL
ncbi:carbohydrate kinase [Virgisporangium aliadipatigenens]|uniref:Carbohydrate kinase n=1 Tax=Virgisporangium aliadipatigenens TaxID=741659 RepID=A0A8J3YX94_9ACTN|nr:rhamnulokinase family protein [Virgisporangium aliadipatigenens]GIJ52308.1 carbohydrate kinase [Virgisporangium aliadipatigenens]